MKQPLLKTYMTPFPYSVEIEAPIGIARMKMLEHNIRHLPVTRNNALVGVISDRDIKLILGPEFGNPNPTEVTVEDAHVENCYSVDINTQLLPVLQHMSENHIGSTIVTTHGRIAGIFTMVDVCKAFAEHLKTQFHPGESEPPKSA